MKYSKQRDAVLNGVLWIDHPTASMVYESVRKTIPNISLSTVYRNLNLLVELGQIKKVELPNHCERFDKTLEHHNHLFCTSCHQLFDIPSSNNNIINNLIEKETGFQIMTNDIIFRGTCKNCKN